MVAGVFYGYHGYRWFFMLSMVIRDCKWLSNYWWFLWLSENIQIKECLKALILNGHDELNYENMYYF